MDTEKPLIRLMLHTLTLDPHLGDLPIFLPALCYLVLSLHETGAAFYPGSTMLCPSDTTL